METTSRKTRLPNSPQPRSALLSELTAWRSTRSVGQGIPEPLWKAAAELARVDGVAPVAAALKLNYYDLQRRVGLPARPRKPRAKSAPFVELPAPITLNRSADPGTVEVTRSNGSRLTLRLPTARVRDLLPLVHAFLRS